MFEILYTEYIGHQIFWHARLVEGTAKPSAHRSGLIRPCCFHIIPFAETPLAEKGSKACSSPMPVVSDHNWELTDYFNHGLIDY